jgi:hypothetical protein
MRGAPSTDDGGRTPTAPRTEEDPAPRLTRFQFWSIFAIGVAIFLFSTGPVWRHPWQIGTLNLAILYSYVPLPFLVAGGLAYKKRLGIKALFLDTLEILLLKYSVTFGVALVLWAFVPAPPPEPPAARAPRTPVPAEPAPPTTPIAPDQTGIVGGVVVGHGGAPLAGALVFVASGLERYVFAAPAAPLVLENDGSGVRPRVAAAVFRQPIQARSGDGHLHTLLAVKDAETVLNVPLLSSGERAPAVFSEAHGVMELRCRVHPREEPALLGIFTHPFFAVTGPDGRFSWAGVPAAPLRIVARTAHEEGSRDVVLVAGGHADLRIETGPP